MTVIFIGLEPPMKTKYMVVVVVALLHGILVARAFVFVNQGAGFVAR